MGRNVGGKKKNSMMTKLARMNDNRGKSGVWIMKGVELMITSYRNDKKSPDK